jgi:ribosome biogenesis GTPase A
MARRQRAHHQLGRIREHLNKGNVVLEVRDARAPLTTDPARLVKIPEDRVRCVVLTKADLADPEVTRAWEAHFRQEGRLVLSLDQTHARKAKKALASLLKQAAGKARSALGVARAVVVGLPNVGKSTLINRVLGRGALRAGDRPGVTKGESWCKLYLLDTPGVIEAMNRLVHEDGGRGALALLRVAPASLLDFPACARRILEDHAALLTPPAPVAAALEAGEDPVAALAHARGRLMTGGEPDRETAAQDALKELARGAWGRLSLERPGDELPTPEDPTGSAG